MSREIFYLSFDKDDGSGGRYQRGDYGLHCGNTFEVRIGGQWIPTRIEHSLSITHSHGWYLVTHPTTCLDGLAVRKEVQ